MKKLIYTLSFLVALPSFAGECNLLKTMEALPSVALQTDGGDTFIKLKKTKNNETQISVVSTPDQENSALIKGTYTYSEKTMKDKKKYCVLERRVAGELLNNLALKTVTSGGLLYVGLGSKDLLNEAIESEDYIVFDF
jgi:hypothetical protein